MLVLAKPHGLANVHTEKRFFTKPVPFVVKPPSTAGAIDREYVYGLKEQKIIDEQQKLRAARATEGSVQEE